jgi:hypothetical protein
MVLTWDRHTCCGVRPDNGSRDYVEKKIMGVNNTFNNILVIVIDCCLTLSNFSAISCPKKDTIDEMVIMVGFFY